MTFSHFRRLCDKCQIEPRHGISIIIDEIKTLIELHFQGFNTYQLDLIFITNVMSTVGQTDIHEQFDE